MKAIVIIIALLWAFVAWPLLLLWAINTLGINVPITVGTWLASTLILLLLSNLFKLARGKGK